MPQGVAKEIILKRRKEKRGEKKNILSLNNNNFSPPLTHPFDGIWWQRLACWLASGWAGQLSGKQQHKERQVPFHAANFFVFCFSWSQNFFSSKVKDRQGQEKNYLVRKANGVLPSSSPHPTPLSSINHFLLKTKEKNRHRKPYCTSWWRS